MYTAQTAFYTMEHDTNTTKGDGISSITKRPSKAKGSRYMITDGRESAGIQNYYVNNVTPEGVNKAFFMTKEGNLLKETSTNSWAYCTRVWDTPIEKLPEELKEKANAISDFLVKCKKEGIEATKLLWDTHEKTTEESIVIIRNQNLQGLEKIGIHINP